MCCNACWGRGEGGGRWGWGRAGQASGQGASLVIERVQSQWPLWCYRCFLKKLYSHCSSLPSYLNGDLVAWYNWGISPPSCNINGYLVQPCLDEDPDGTLGVHSLTCETWYSLLWVIRRNCQHNTIPLCQSLGRPDCSAAAKTLCMCVCGVCVCAVHICKCQSVMQCVYNVSTTCIHNYTDHCNYTLTHNVKLFPMIPLILFCHITRNERKLSLIDNQYIKNL